MNAESTKQIAWSSKEFWEFYDEFCTISNIVKLNQERDNPLAAKMHALTHAAHLTHEIHKLKRPDKGWHYNHAWLALKNADIQRDDGESSGVYMRAGDVIVIEHGWDRDVIITHAPIPRNIVCGYLLSGKWEPMRGLFLPLFEKETIQTCITIRLGENTKEARSLTNKEAGEWGWYS